MNTLKRSRLYNSLRWKYIEQRLRIYVAAGIIAWMGWMWMMLNGMVYLAGQKIVIFN